MSAGYRQALQRVVRIIKRFGGGGGGLEIFKGGGYINLDIVPIAPLLESIYTYVFVEIVSPT